ncbi:MAG: ABC transporter permease subunit [Candidatus Paceibacterota bacterium]
MPHSTNTYLFVALVVVLAATAGLVGSLDIAARIPYIPFQETADTVIGWLNTNLDPLFSSIAFIITSLLTPIHYFFTQAPSVLVIAVLASLGYLLDTWRLCLLILISLLFVTSFGLFDETMITLSLVITSTLFALLVGIPLGIAKAHSHTLANSVDPLLDFMQIVPLFIYLIPAILFFSIGIIPGIVATFIFSIPPAVHLTALGIKQIPDEYLEVSRAFGATPFQSLRKIELPLALPSIMAGVHQTTLLSLSMIVAASVVGVPGLGEVVYASLTQSQIGQSIVSGISVVLLAVMLDRVARATNKHVSRHS